MRNGGQVGHGNYFHHIVLSNEVPELFQGIVNLLLYKLKYSASFSSFCSDRAGSEP